MSASVMAMPVGGGSAAVAAPTTGSVAMPPMPAQMPAYNYGGSPYHTALPEVTPAPGAHSVSTVVHAPGTYTGQPTYGQPTYAAHPYGVHPGVYGAAPTYVTAPPAAAAPSVAAAPTVFPTDPTSGYAHPAVHTLPEDVGNMSNEELCRHAHQHGKPVQVGLPSAMSMVAYPTDHGPSAHTAPYTSSYAGGTVGNAIPAVVTPASPVSQPAPDAAAAPEKKEKKKKKASKKKKKGGCC